MRAVTDRPLQIQARLKSPTTLVADGATVAPEDIQWMPPGRHRIVPFVDGEPREIEVTVDASLAERFNGHLQRLWAEARAGRGDEPFIDFNHADQEAAGQPLELYWAGEDPRTGGIRARVRWSAAGKAAVEGRTFRRFSPQWFTDPETLEPLGVGVNLGGLVNRAAFQAIAPVVAKHGHPSHATQPQVPMTEPELKPLIIAAVAAALAPFETRLAALEKPPATAQGADARLTEFDTRLKAVESQRQTDAVARAKAIVQAACAAGRISPQDTETIGFWEQTLQMNPAAEAQLAKLPVNPAFAQLTQAGAGGTSAAAAAAGTPAEQFVAEVRARRAELKDGTKAMQTVIATNPELYKAWRDANGKPGI